MSDVEVNTCILDLSATFMASQACSISSATHLARDAIVEPFTLFAIKFTPSQSPGDEAAKPASITSTFNFSNC